MKRLPLIVVFIISFAAIVNADIVNITGDQTLSGNYHVLYERIYRVDYGFPLANSQILIQDALIDRFETYGTSHTTIQAIEYNRSTVQYLRSCEDSTVDVIKANAFSITCDGGIMNLYDLQHSTMDVHYVYSSIAKQGIMNIYATNCQWSFNGSSADLTGYWFNGDLFQLHFRNYQESTLENIYIIPEPATILLFGFMGMLLRRKKK